MHQIALQFDNVSFRYPDGFNALRGVSFTISRGERVALVGLNGAGKSTLLLHTNALLSPTEGSVAVDGTVIGSKNEIEARQKVGMVFQDADSQLFMPTVEADVAFGPRNMGLDDDEIERRVSQALDATGCSALRRRSPSQLSGGQKRMVSVATVLAMRPAILVLDEPTAGLDYRARSQLIELLENIGTTILLATHDMDLARRICRRALIIDEGRLTFDGPMANLPYPPQQCL